MKNMGREEARRKQHSKVDHHNQNHEAQPHTVHGPQAQFLTLRTAHHVGCRSKRGNAYILLNHPESNTQVTPHGSHQQIPDAPVSQTALH